MKRLGIKKWIILLIIMGYAVNTGIFAQTIRILPLGNSITDGDDSTHPDEGNRIAYRYNLYNLLTSAGYDFEFVGHRDGGYEYFTEISHCGIPGTRDQYLAQTLNNGWDERWQEQVTIGNAPYLDVYPADIILLHIGTNDITHGEGTSAAAVAQILDEIDAYESRSGNEVIVFVARIINRMTYNSTTTEFNDNVAAMVSARNDANVIMVDMEDGAGINYSTEMQSDGIHPTPEGYAKIAAKWFEAIQSLNKEPYFSSTPVTTAIEDETYAYTVTVEDENSTDNLTIIASSIPSWCTFIDYGDNTGLLSGIPGDSDIGDHSVTLNVSDGKAIGTQAFTIEVQDSPDAPVITGQKEISTDEDIEITLVKSDFTIVDVDTDPEDIDIILLDGEYYTVNGLTIIPEQDFYGTLNVNIKASDQISESSVYHALVTVNAVNDPPVLSGQATTFEAKHYVPLSIQVTDLVFNDVDNNQADLSVIIQPHPDEIYTTNGNQLTVQTDTLGTLEVDLVMFDGEDESNIFGIQITVVPLNSPPVFTTAPATEALTNSIYYYLVGAEDPDGDNLSFYSTNIPDWLGFNDVLNFIGGTPTEDDIGMWWVGIEVTDGRYRVEQLFQLNVELDTSTASQIEIEASGGAKLLKQLYPIPSRDYLYIKTLLDGEYNVSVFSVSGKMLINKELGFSSGIPVALDVSDFNPGVYFLKVNKDKESEIKRFVVYR